MQKTLRLKKRFSELRHHRLLHCMTRGELAYKAGMPKNVYEEIENGNMKCTELNARRIAMALNMPFEWQKFTVLDEISEKIA